MVGSGIGIFFAIVLVVGATALIVTLERAATAGRLRVLTQVSRLLGAPRRGAGLNEVSGRHHEQAVTFRLTHRGSGKSRRPWTEVDVAVPAGLVSFALRAQTPAEVRMRGRGLVVDVETGDEAFDDAFIVEAAPADVTRELLVDEVRRAALAARPFAVVTRGGLLRVETPGHDLTPERAPALIDFATRLAAGMRPAHARADAALEAAAAPIGAPYRAEPNAEEVRARKRARLDEIAELEAVKQRRATFHRLLALGAIAALVVVYLLIMAAGKR